MWSRDLNMNFTLGNYFFEFVKLAKNAGVDKCEYSVYGIRFDTCSQFSLLRGELSKIFLFFGLDNSLSVHADDIKKIY